MDARLVRPGPEHQALYEAMMDEWEAFGGRLNPGALRRWSHRQRRKIPYAEWLSWMEEDRRSGQDLYFYMEGDRLLGAISLRFGDNPHIAEDGHIGYGVRPSARCHGCASRMLALALPIARDMGLHPVVITCAADNIASAKVIERNGGILAETRGESEEKELVYHVFA